MRNTKLAALVIAIVSTQGCFSGAYSAGIAARVWDDRGPGVAHPLGTPPGTPAVMHPSDGYGDAGMFLPRLNGTYSRPSAPTIKASTAQKVFSGIDTFVYVSCVLSEITSRSSDYRCERAIDAAVPLRAPPPILR